MLIIDNMLNYWAIFICFFNFILFIDNHARFGVSLPAQKSISLNPSSHIRQPSRQNLCRRSIFGVVVLASFLSACAVFKSAPIHGGSLIEPDDYNQLIPGSSTRSDAIDLLGSPSSKGAFNDNTWIYLSNVSHSTPMNFPRVTKQQVVVLKFSPTGTLKSIRTLSIKDSMHVAMVSKITPTPGSKINVLEQILGNVGRYNPMQNLSGLMGTGMNQLGHFGSGNAL